MGITKDKIIKYEWKGNREVTKKYLIFLDSFKKYILILQLLLLYFLNLNLYQTILDEYRVRSYRLD